MVSSAAKTVDAYLAELLPERRAVVATVRDIVNAHLPPGYEENMNWGMISWEIPLSRYPVTYNKQPLSFAALAAQKNSYSLYLMAVDGGSERERQLRDAAAALGRKLDMGKCCVRFKQPDHLPLQAIGALIASVPVEAYIAQYEAARGIVR
jgi:Domain of unknown function (DU1801)